MVSKRWRKIKAKRLLRSKYRRRAKRGEAVGLQTRRYKEHWIRCISILGELLQHLEGGASPPLLLCPAALNRVLEAAVSASLVGNSDPLTGNLTFLLRDNHLKSVGIPGIRRKILVELLKSCNALS
jgi:hypothetical protein